MNVKTFKMLSFSLNEPNGKRALPIIDGLVINQENSFQTWILELFLSNEHRALFENLLSTGDVFEADVTISFPDNDPAKFTLVVDLIKDINDQISVLMKGKIMNPIRKPKADTLLNELAKLGLSEQEIIAELTKRQNGK